LLPFLVRCGIGRRVATALRVRASEQKRSSGSALDSTEETAWGTNRQANHRQIRPRLSPRTLMAGKEIGSSTSRTSVVSNRIARTGEPKVNRPGFVGGGGY
jgi:hypothetical protein